MTKMQGYVPGLATFKGSSDAHEDYAFDSTFPRKGFKYKHTQDYESILPDAKQFSGSRISARLKAIRSRALGQAQDEDVEVESSDADTAEESDAKAYGSLKRVLAKKPNIDFQNLPPQLKEAIKKLTRRKTISPNASLKELLSSVRLIGPAKALLDSSGIILSDTSSEQLEKLNAQSETMIRRIYHALKRKRNITTNSDIAILDHELLDEIFQYFKGGLLNNDLTFTPVSNRLAEINKAGQYGITIGQTIARMGQILVMSGHIHGTTNISETEKVAKSLKLVTVKSYLCPINHHNIAFYLQFLRNSSRSMDTGFFTIIDENSERISFEPKFQTFMSHQEIDEQISNWAALIKDLITVTNPWNDPDYNDAYYIQDLTPQLFHRVQQQLGMVPNYSETTVGEVKERLESAIGFLLRQTKQTEVARLLSPTKLTGSFFLDCEYQLQQSNLNLDYGYFGDCLCIVNTDEMKYSELLESPVEFSTLETSEQITIMSRALKFQPTCRSQTYLEP